MLRPHPASLQAALALFIDSRQKLRNGYVAPEKLTLEMLSPTALLDENSTEKTIVEEIKGDHLNRQLIVFYIKELIVNITVEPTDFEKFFGIIFDEINAVPGSCHAIFFPKYFLHLAEIDSFHQSIYDALIQFSIAKRFAEAVCLDAILSHNTFTDINPKQKKIARELIIEKLIKKIKTNKHREEKLLQFDALYFLAKYYLNIHRHSKVDEKLHIKNTHTWQLVMEKIRASAYQVLVENQRALVDNAAKIKLLKTALKSKLFTEQRTNWGLLFFTTTATAKRINASIKKLEKEKNAACPSLSLST